MSAGDQKYRRFGSYVLLQRSGAGGMGRVDVAISTRARGMQRLCVVKRVRADLRTEEQEARFRREAEIAIGLSHGAIAQTLDVEEIDGELCILQEYIHGTTLSYLETRAASRSPLPIPLTVHVISEVTRALAYAHTLPGPGIVHRDVTPDNIMLSFTGEVKLIDFGIAKVVGDESLTQARLVVGRPLFTAPEALAGGVADHRADIYSVGVVMWMCLTGRQFPDVFERGPASPPSAFNPGVTPALDAVCLRAIAMRPEGRYQSAEELLDALISLTVSRMHDRKVARFLADHFDVASERSDLRRDITDARDQLDEATMIAAPSFFDPIVTRSPLDLDDAVPASDRSRREERAGHLGLGVLMGVAAATLTAWALWPSPLLPSPSPACPPAVAATTAPVLPGAPAPVTSSPLPARAADNPPEQLPVAPAASPSELHPLASAPSLLDQRPGRKQPRRGSQASQPTPATPSPNVDELLRSATAELKAGSLDRAFQLANAAVQTGAGAPAHLILGKVFFARSDLARAELEFRKVASLRPGDREATRALEAIRAQAAHGP
jgi:serine/threonine protein kinase